MRRLLATSVIVVSTIGSAMAQPQLVSTLNSLPTGKTINDYYKQAVYDPTQTKIGAVDDVLINDQGQVTAFIVGVGGVAGMGEKDVAVAFSAVRATQKNGQWYLTLDTTKDALKAAPGFTFDKTKSSWVLVK